MNDEVYPDFERLELTFSVLVHDLVDRPGHPTRAALDRVLEHLRERLL